MPKYEFRIDKEAQKHFRRLPQDVQARLRRRFEEIADDPHSRAYSKPLHNLGGFRSSRVGKWRIVFVISESEQLYQSGRTTP